MKVAMDPADEHPRLIIQRIHRVTEGAAEQFLGKDEIWTSALEGGTKIRLQRELLGADFFESNYGDIEDVRIPAAADTNARSTLYLKKRGGCTRLFRSVNSYQLSACRSIRKSQSAALADTLGCPQVPLDG